MPASDDIETSQSGDDPSDRSIPGRWSEWKVSPWMLGLLLLVFLLGCFPLENSDIWWHLRAGQMIAERGEVPRTDWFTYTNPESQWLDLHWTFQLSVAWLFSIGGPTAIVLAKCVICTLTIAIALGITRRDWSAEVTVACWLVPVTIFAGRYFARPEVLTLLYLTCTLSILFHARRNWKWILLLPLVQVLWVNVQGLFVLQFVIIGAFGLEQLLRYASPNLERVFRIDEHDVRLPLWPMVAVGLVTLCASLVNPYGFRGATFPLTLLSTVGGDNREFFLNYAGEFAGLGIFIRENGFAAVFANMTTASLVVLTMLVLISFVLLLQFRRISIYRLLLLVGFAWLAWQMNRNAVLYAMVGGAVLRLNIGQWWDLKRAPDGVTRQQRKSRKNREPTLWEKPAAIRAFRIGLAIFIGVQLIAVPTGTYHNLRRSMFDRQFGLGEHLWYPHDGAVFLQDDRLPDRVYAANLGVAATCIFHLVPERKIFADARLETNTKQVLQAHTDVLDRIASGDEYESLLRAAFAENHDPKVEADREMPAIMLGNDTLITARGVRIYRNLLKDDRWRCVFLQTNIGPAFVGDERDMKLLSRGEAVFITTELAEKIGFPPADTRLLEGLMRQLESLKGQ